ncbi:hypothetical protein [Streptomyces bacillaris]|uniref:hypothetical protein n=1 Tax=Streptomyces bacillaris TaxID=68179 RepID=UPI00346732F6
MMPTSRYVVQCAPAIGRRERVRTALVGLRHTGRDPSTPLSPHTVVRPELRAP